jgi:hypothetical protein
MLARDYGMDYGMDYGIRASPANRSQAIILVGVAASL